MENQHLSLLDRVYTVLRKRGEETEWITSADDHNIKTGIAFVPCDTFTPVSLLYTMIERPETLVIDVLFAAKVPENRRVEVSIILSELNADQTAGAFQLDPNSGYVYYRQSFVLEGMDLTEAQFAQLMILKPWLWKRRRPILTSWRRNIPNNGTRFPRNC